jgi:CheY-specific phosphatase CheX
MPNHPVILQRERLLDTLHTCVDEVFALMVCSFNEAAIKQVDAADVQSDDAIRFREQDGPAKSVEVEEQVTIRFNGDANGCVVLRCSLEGADNIARGLLMLEEGGFLELSAIRDALGECANMLAGSLKTKALDPVGSFKLGLPSFSDPMHAGNMEGALVYRVAEGVMSVEVWLD